MTGIVWKFAKADCPSQKEELTGIEKNRATVAREFPCCICKSLIVLVMLPFIADIVPESARMSQCSNGSVTRESNVLCE